VDLSYQTVKEKIVDNKIMEKIIGGLGIGVKILYELVKPDIDPPTKDNIIVMVIGPLSDTTAPINGRTHILTKSPITGVIGMGNFGGSWGASGKNIVFGIYQRNGKVLTFPFLIPCRETIIPLIDRYTQTGSLYYYTDDRFIYNSLPV